MHKYAVLMHPGQSRVFFDQSKGMSLAELELCCARMDSGCKNIEQKAICGVDYICFDAENPLSPRDIDLLSRLSFFYALFKLHGKDESTCLLPVSPSGFEGFGVNIAGMLKYSGKTNETFTRMITNAAIFSSDFQHDSSPALKLVDPVCGKGTTLFDGAYCGYDVYGAEVAEKVVNEAAVFFRKFLESERLKHTFQKQRQSGPNKSYSANVYKFTYARSKEGLKSPLEARELNLVAGNSMHLSSFFGKNFAHVIVGDLPYGVAHGNVSGAQQSAKTRNPKELLKSCLPSWIETLKKGGVIALSWNVFLISKEEIAKVLQAGGLTVLTGGPYDKFEHRVDQAIKRDIILAKKL
ncbi:MAG: TRM11 family SAM-dependent methyltransferase [Christensenellales bacterium]|jgi:hypothetical protein